jgi:putative transcriptional regulator
VTISHHPDDATLMAFASGTIGEAHGIVVSAHLSLCAACRARLRTGHEIGGAVLESETSSAVSATCRAATMASLDGISPAPRAPAPVPSNLPPALARLTGGRPFSELPWMKKAPGVAMVDLPLSSEGRTRLKLLSIGPGRTMPEHGHGGEEITLVLQGSYCDHIGRFVAGDVADLDQDVEHMPRVDSAETCICLVATEAPTRFKALWARLFQPFAGI